MNVVLGDVVALVGFDVEQQRTSESATPSSLDLTFYWQALATADEDYTVFVHVRNEAGEVVAQKDSPPTGGIYPTSLWDAGEIIKDEVHLPLDGLSAGSYDVEVGMYDYVTGSRLKLEGTMENTISLSSIEVEAE